MSNEIRVVDLPGLTLYANVVGPTGLIWNTNTLAFEALNSAHWTNYALALTAQTVTSIYYADFPTGITTAGSYTLPIYLRSGATPAITDLAWSEAETSPLYFNGTVVLPAPGPPSSPGYATLYGNAFPSVGALSLSTVTLSYTRNGLTPGVVDLLYYGPVTDTLALDVGSDGSWQASMAAALTGTSYTVSLTVGDVTTTKTLSLTGGVSTAF